MSQKTILIADDSIPFDGDTLRQRPLGGAETALVHLAETLARRGHRVRVHNRSERAHTHAGVEWAPLSDPWLPDSAVDVYIANRKSHLIARLPRVKKRIFWIHNPAQHLMKPRFWWPLFRHRPTIVFSGAYHASTYPRWGAPVPRTIIPYGLDHMFITGTRAAHTKAPAPRAIFTSNPQRGLAWLLDVWARHIHPACPLAELHLFAGPQVYHGIAPARADEMRSLLHRARDLRETHGVVVNDPLPKTFLIPQLQNARVMLYRGDAGETFCYSLAEAQALGVPCVVQNHGSVAERVIDSKTGFVTHDDVGFAKAAVRLLTDDTLWLHQHRTCLEQQRAFTWDHAAAHFETLF